MKTPQRSYSAWRSLILIGATLACVFAGVAYIQVRQADMLNTAARYEGDNIVWAYFQLETESMRLQTTIEHVLNHEQDRAELQERYDIFVSRVGVVDHGLYSSLLDGTQEYQQARPKLDAFIRKADAYFGRQSGAELELDGLRRLDTELDLLSGPLHDLSLVANQRMAEQVDARNKSMQQHIVVSNWLMAFEWALILGFATIVVRQLRQLERRRHELEELTDVLEQARVQAEAGSMAKSVFLANMSHEIRTPLNGVLGMLSLLGDCNPTPVQADYIKTAEESARHLMALLNDVLDASKLESGKLDLLPTVCNLRQLLLQCESLMRGQAVSKGLAMRMALDLNVPEWVLCDPTRLRQILLNLLSNAIKFTEIGAVTIQAEAAESGAEAGAVLRITVRDTGIGMDDATLARLFKRFSQGDSSTVRQYGGSGLGLEISQNLAQLMGGDITVHSALGAGSVFVLSLPLQAMNAPEGRVKTGSEADPAGLERQLRVLVVDDNPINRKYMQAMLQKQGHLVTVIQDGAEAVEAAARQPFDLVLMDLHMPAMDGIEATGHLRERAMTPGMKIVALTADVLAETRDKALAGGLDDFLAKPLHVTEFHAMLERQFGNGPAREPNAEPTLLPALLDVAMIEKMTEMLTLEKYRELVAQFFAGKVGRVDELLAAALAGQRDQVRRHSHNLKGAALTLGFSALGGSCAGLERLALAAEEGLADEAERVGLLFDSTRSACIAAGYLAGMDLPALR